MMAPDLDDVLEGIEGLAGKDLKRRRNEYIQCIARQLDSTSSDLSQDALFRPANPDRVKRYVAAALLRLLAHNKEALWEDSELRLKSLALFDEALKDVYKEAKIDTSLDSHLKLAKLEELESELFRGFERIAAGITSVHAALSSRQALMRLIGSRKSKIFLDSFCNLRIINADRITELFRSLEEYAVSKGMAKMNAYTQLEGIFGEYLKDAACSKDQISINCFHSFFSTIFQLAREDFGSSDAIKPTVVGLRDSGRKYPFHNLEAQIQIKVLLENVGPGYAFDVCVEVEDAENLIVDYAYQATQMKVESQDLYIPVSPTGPSGSAREILCKVTWRNYDNTLGQQDFLFAFYGQRDDTEWAKIKTRRPYSLQAVETEDQLVGRKDLINGIYDNIIADTIQSSLVFGQKRVGKTSIGRTLTSKLEREHNIFPIFIKVGDLSKISALRFINTLADAIVQEILMSRDFCDLSLERPTFDGVLSPPLAQFFRHLKRIRPHQKFIIIIDEFDEIPSELYRYTEVGDTFFHNLRSLSQEASQLGFILIGGENMQIIRQSTDRLNLFEPYKVDYFDKSRYYSDFRDLITKPVDNILEFGDDAIELIYAYSEGNPFYTNYICASLFRQACERRDSYISVDEVEDSIREVVTRLDTVNVSHFWLDGIWANEPERIDEIQTQRRKLLIAYADILKNNGRVTRQSLFDCILLRDVSIDSIIESFLNRGILYEEQGSYRLKPYIFQEWLVEIGSQQLSSNFTDAKAIEELRDKDAAAYVLDNELVELVSKWDLYRSSRITPSHVRAWLDQFKNNEERRLMFKLLKAVRFYSESIVREKLRIIHAYVRQNVTYRIEKGERLSRGFLLTSFGQPIKSSSSLARIYAVENKVISQNACSVEDISKHLMGDEGSRISAVVIVDDIIGTGGSAISGLDELRQSCGSILSERNVKVVIGAICATESGLSAVSQFCKELAFRTDIYTCDQLDDSDRCFSDSSFIFRDPAERQKARETARQYGVMLDKKQPLGHKGGELVVVFHDTCPNNSLPILWKDIPGFWNPLFKRN